MATITRADGTVEDAGESLGEFQARLTAKRIRERGLSRYEKKSGYSEKQILDYYDSKTAEASRQRAEQQKAIDEASKIDPFKQSQPKGSYAVTKASGEVVYRTSGVNAQGRYVNDVYARIQEQQNIQKATSQYKNIPKSAKKVMTSEGEVYRTLVKSGGKTIVTDYKPGGVKETKVLSKSYSGGESLFIPKQKKSNALLPPSPILDFVSNLKGSAAPDLAPGYEARIKKLVEREENLSRTKAFIYEKLRLTPKKNPKFYNYPLEIVKGVARVPFEIAGLPVFLGGRVSFATESIFRKEGRKELVRALKATPSAVREIYVSKDTETGKYKITPQNIVNIGLSAYSVRSIAKSPSNVGLKVYEKYAKTDIKGSIQGYQGTTVFKSAGKLKGRPYQETTVFKGKSSTSTIKYQGKTFIINRNAKGTGTYRIIQPKTRISIKRTGLIPKGIRLYKDTVVLKTGKFTVGGKPINFKTGGGITTQDITFLNQRPLATTYLRYLEQLKAQSKAQATIKSGSQNLQFQAKANINVKADVGGVITNQRVALDRIDYQSGRLSVTREFNKPTIQFAKNPKQPPDVLISRYVKDGKAITGYEKGYIAQPRYVLRGPQDAFVKGSFTIKGGSGFNIFKNFKNPFTKLSIKPISTFKPVIPKETKGTGVSPTKIVEKPIKTNIEVKSPYASKPAPLSQQIALTDQIRAETVYNIPFQTKSPSIQYANVNFDLLNAPLGNVKPVPLVPVIKESVLSKPPTTRTLINSIFQLEPVSKVNIYRTVQSANITYSKSIIRQIQQQKPLTELRIGQKAQSSQASKPASVIEQLQNQAQISTQIQTQKQIARQETAISNLFQRTPSPSFPGLPELQLFQLPKPFAFPKASFNIPKSKGFDVFTRIKGVFKKANIKPLSEVEAINFGAYKVGTTSQASFRIKESGTEAQDVFKLKGNLADFYKKDDIFIEKKERRIKSIGELQEITFKGIRSRKIKKIFGGK